MFDAKSLLEALIAGGQGAGSRSQPQGIPGGGDLSEMFNQMFPGAAKANKTNIPNAGFGDVQDAFGKMFKDFADAGKQFTPPASNTKKPGDLGDLGDLFGKIFEQATTGMKEGATKINDSMGTGNALNDFAAKYGGGRSMEEIIEVAKKYMADNKLGTGAALGGLGALVLGTQTGRAIAVNAAKIGALALIGGLAYKAYQNHQSGRPIISGLEPTEPAPNGSGFEPDAISNENAVRYLRAMIAAAAADGRIDANEQKTIFSNLNSLNLGPGAEEFLANELNNPANIGDLISNVMSRKEAIQVYTAARIVIDPDTHGEDRFLTVLANQLGLEDDLVAHIDAAARNLPS